MTQSITLYQDSWQIRVSDPGEEGAHSHLFDTTRVRLDVEKTADQLQFHFLRQTEERVEQQLTLTELADVFRLMSEYLDAVGLGQLGVQIGKLSA